MVLRVIQLSLTIKLKLSSYYGSQAVDVKPYFFKICIDIPLLDAAGTGMIFIVWNK
jgi:hypothetical protein